MQNKIYFLLLVLFVIVLRPASTNRDFKKGDSALDGTTYVEDNDKEKQSQKSGNNQRQSSNRHDQNYLSSPSFNMYQLKPHWPPTYGPLDVNQRFPYQYNFKDLIINLLKSPPPVGVPDNNVYANKEPTCHALLDSQYPQFSDICGTLPQVRYSLPNAFGHVQKWQIAQLLSTILSSSTLTSANPTCYRNLRLLICPLLFPPCPTRDEPSTVLPCQPFCQAVKSQCAAPSLDLLLCDFLPAKSSLCPVYQKPYNFLQSSVVHPITVNTGTRLSSTQQHELPSILAQSALSLGLPPSGETIPAVPLPGSPTILSQPTSYPSVAPQATFFSFAEPTSSVSVPARSLVSAPASSLVSPSSYQQQWNQVKYMTDASTPVLVNVPPIVYA